MRGLVDAGVGDDHVKHDEHVVEIVVTDRNPIIYFSMKY